MITFKDLFKNVPDSLKTTVFVRLGLAIISIIAFVVAWISFGFSVSCPIIAIAAFFSVSGVGMCYNCLKGNYVRITGKCTNIELTSVRGKIKWVYITSDEDEKMLRFPPKENSKKINIGDDVIAYIPSRVLIYQDNSIFCVPEYYCIDVLSKKMMKK